MVMTMSWPPDMDTGDARDDEIRNLKTENHMLSKEIEELRAEVDFWKYSADKYWQQAMQYLKRLEDEPMRQQMQRFAEAMSRFDIG
jgi:hypothetical protein